MIIYLNIKWKVHRMYLNYLSRINVLVMLVGATLVGLHGAKSCKCYRDDVGSIQDPTYMCCKNNDSYTPWVWCNDGAGNSYMASPWSIYNGSNPIPLNNMFPGDPCTIETGSSRTANQASHFLHKEGTAKKKGK